MGVGTSVTTGVVTGSGRSATCSGTVQEGAKAACSANASTCCGVGENLKVQATILRRAF